MQHPEGGNQMDDHVVAVNVPEAARRLGVSPRTVATLVAQKELPSRKIGRRRVIPIRALEEFLKRDHATSQTPRKVVVAADRSAG